MGTSAALFQQRLPGLRAQPLRLLHAWHLLSLDAPTVAFCWVLVFARAAHLAHALEAALALAGAVWLIYAMDRLLDALPWRQAKNDPSCASRLCSIYARHAHGFALACLPVLVGTVLLLLRTPRLLREDWLLLCVPLLGYAAAVHLLRLPARWKAVCVSLFFGLAVALPAAVQAGLHLPLCLGAAAFGCVCRLNCEVLLQGPKRLRAAAVACTSTVALLLPFQDLRSVAAGCGLATLTLMGLRWKAAHLGPLTFRALVDAALVLPAVLVLLVR